MAQAEMYIELTAAAATKEFFVGVGDVVPLCASGLTADEVIAIECMTPAGYAQYVSNGISAQLSTATNKVGIDIPGRYRLNKPTTAGAVGVLRDAS